MVRLFGDRKCEVGCSRAQIREMVWGFLALCVSLTFPVASIERHKEPTSLLGSLSVARDLTAIEVGKKVYKKSQNMTRPNVEIWGYIGWQGRHGKINSIIKKMAFPSSPPNCPHPTRPPPPPPTYSLSCPLLQLDPKPKQNSPQASAWISSL